MFNKLKTENKVFNFAIVRRPTLVRMMGTARNMDRTHTTTTTSLYQTSISRGTKTKLWSIFGIRYRNLKFPTTKRRQITFGSEIPAISKSTDPTCLHWIDNHHKPVLQRRLTDKIKHLFKEIFILITSIPRKQRWKVGWFVKMMNGSGSQIISSRESCKIGNSHWQRTKFCLGFVVSIVVNTILWKIVGLKKYCTTIGIWDKKADFRI